MNLLLLVIDVVVISPQHFDLLPQLSDDPGVGIFVDDGVIDDAFGSVRVSQRRQRLFVIVGGG